MNRQPASICKPCRVSACHLRILQLERFWQNRLVFEISKLAFLCQPEQKTCSESPQDFIAARNSQSWQLARGDLRHSAQSLICRLLTVAIGEPGAKLRSLKGDEMLVMHGAHNNKQRQLSKRAKSGSYTPSLEPDLISWTAFCYLDVFDTPHLHGRRGR